MFKCVCKHEQETCEKRNTQSGRFLGAIRELGQPGDQQEETAEPRLELIFLFV